MHIDNQATTMESLATPMILLLYAGPSNHKALDVATQTKAPRHKPPTT